MRIVVERCCTAGTQWHPGWMHTRSPFVGKQDSTPSASATNAAGVNVSDLSVFAMRSCALRRG